MGFLRQEYWNGLPFPSPGDLPDPGIEHQSSTLQAGSLPSEPTGKPSKYSKILKKKKKQLVKCIKCNQVAEGAELNKD